MIKEIFRFRKTVLFSIFLVTILSSCVTQKNTTYFKDLGPAADTLLETAKFTEPVIQVDDILSISILTYDPKSSEIINQGANTPVVGSASPVGTAQQINGFLVDKSGEIEIFMIGKVKVAGLTTAEAREKIKQLVAVNYNQASVQVRFANFKVTVLGEVARPATYTLPNEKVSVLDVIGLAGDLTIYGKRENVLVLRDNNGKKELGRLDLNSVNVFNSPYYYLKQNDILYIEPNKSKIASTDASRTRLITIGASIASAIIVLLIRVL